MLLERGRRGSHRSGFRDVRRFGASVAILLCAAFPSATPSAAETSPTSVWDGDGNQSNANYGYAVATAGDINGDGFSDILVSARSYDAGQLNEGRVFLYHGGPTGPTLQADWITEGEQDIAFYGSSVGPAGDVNGDGYSDVIIGAPSFDAPLSNEGKAYVYLGSQGGLAGSPVWTAVGGQQSATFGNGVATAGDVNGDGFDDVIVGARGWDGAEDNAGRALVFHGGVAGPDSGAAWTVDGTQDNEAFGWSVATAGDVNADGFDDVIVGAFFHDDVVNNSGAAFVYLGSASGLDTTPVWSATGNQGNAGFGWSVAPAGDVNGDGYADVIVGARYFNGAFADGGKAFVYLGTSTGLQSTPIWTTEGTQTDAFLGWSVGTAGDVNGDGLADVIVGAYRTDVMWVDDGQASIFLGTSDGVSDTAAWTHSSLQEGASFGWSVAAAGDVNADGFGDVIVGAYFHDDGQDNEGRASLFFGGAELPQEDPWWKGNSGPAAGAYGFAVAYAGDVNGDALTDMLVSDPFADLAVSDEGRVDLFLGAESGPDTAPSWSTGGTAANENWGKAIAGAGDVNGDGYEDVIIGAPFHTSALFEEGKAALFLGSPIGLGATASWEVLGGAASAEMGASVAGVGDVNGDGFADVAVGVPDRTGGAVESGIVLVYEGTSSGPGVIPSSTLLGIESGARFGASVSGAGDVNGDGYDDVLVGEPEASGGGANAGRAHLYLGSAGGLASAVAWSVSGSEPGARFGEVVAAAGDLNGDGYADFAIVASAEDGASVDEGVVHVFFGAPGGPALTADWVWASGQSDVFLDAVASAGDANGDGFGDLLVGISRWIDGEPREGRVVFFAGADSGLAASPDREWLGGTAFARFGSALAGRGDPDGNGWSDLLIGSRGWADSSSAGGAAFLVASNGSGAGTLGLQQRRSDDSAPIAPGGRSDSPSGFRVKALGGSPAGRTDVALEWEVKEFGTPFDGMTTVGSLQDSGTPVPGVGSRVPLIGDVTGLQSNTAYVWRVRTRSGSPFFPGSPWFTLVANGRTETDLRTGSAVSAPVVAAGFPSLGVSAAPNPFDAGCRVRFRLARPADVVLTVFDVSGRRVRTLARGRFNAGRHTVPWTGLDDAGRSVAPGVYWVTVRAGDHTESASVVRLR